MSSEGGVPSELGLTWQEAVVDEDGEVLSGRWVFACACGRAQGYAPAELDGGITEVEAEGLGWRRVNGEWICPLCAGHKRREPS